VDAGGICIAITNRVNDGFVGRYSRYIELLKNEFVYGGYLTSLGCPAFVLCVSILLNTAIDWTVLLIAYLTPLIIYSYNYYGELEHDVATNPERAVHLRKKASLYPYIIGSYLALLALLLYLYASYVMIIFVLILVFCGIFYTVLLKDITKVIPGFKGVYIAFIWALAGTFFFNIHYAISFNLFHILIFLFIFLKGMINVTFFDIKDIEGDRERGLKTIPVMWGKERTLNYLHLLNVFAFIPLLAGIFLNVIPVYALSLTVFFFYDLYYLKKADTANGKNLRMISYMMADAEFILWPVMLMIAGALYYGLFH
jgi:4-hydroxybenzoate polyprenyltransferase